MEPMTSPDFRKALAKNRKKTIRKLAGHMTVDAPHSVLAGLYIGLQTGDTPLCKMTDDELLDVAEGECLIEEIGRCRFCEEPVGKDYHLHQGFMVGHDCCWDERLRSTE